MAPISLEAFKKLTIAKMKAEIQSAMADGHVITTRGCVKKADYVARWQEHLRGGEPGDDEQTEEQLDEPEKAATTTQTAILRSICMSPLTEVSNHTAKVLELLGYKHFEVKSPEDDISDVLKTANDFAESFHSTLDSTVLDSDHSTNWALVFKRLRELYPEVQVSASLVEFFNSFGIDTTMEDPKELSQGHDNRTPVLNEEERDVSLAIHRSLLGRGAPSGAGGVAASDENQGIEEGGVTEEEEIRKELDVLRNAIEYRCQKWSQTFPQRSPLNCRWPTDFNADEKQQVRSFITAWLDDGHDDLWSRDKSQAEQDNAVEAMLKREPYPFADDKGRTATCIKAAFLAVITQRHQSKERSASRASSVASDVVAGPSGTHRTDQEDDASSTPQLASPSSTPKTNKDRRARPRRSLEEIFPSEDEDEDATVSTPDPTSNPKDKGKGKAAADPKGKGKGKRTADDVDSGSEYGESLEDTAPKRIKAVRDRAS